MPTARQRWTITETEDVARAIDLAAREWPTIRSRQQLLLQLILRGHEAIDEERERAVADRRKAIRETAGIWSYPPNYLEDLRKDWPE